MANGNEIWLGYTYPEYHEKAPKDAPRIPWPLPTDGSEDGPLEEFPDLLYLYSRNTRDPLIEAWIAACTELGWDKIGPRKKEKLLPRLRQKKTKNKDLKQNPLRRSGGAGD